MNLYVRYFDNETLVYSINELFDFLESIDEITLNSSLINDIREYVESDVVYPKRYKVRPRVYFIIIKTEAASMKDFKEKKCLRTNAHEGGPNVQKIDDNIWGWYEASLTFKRVVMNHLGKCEYRDTTFTVQCKAETPQECYDRIIEYLRDRVDSRSQFPSAKGKNFTYKFLGLCKPENQDNATEESNGEEAPVDATVAQA